jgi:hypothetical protein
MATVCYTARHRRIGIACAALLVFVALASGALAQSASGGDWQRGTTISGFIGGATASDTDLAAGLSVGWEVTPRFGIEGRGLWLGAGDDEDGFAAALAARLAFLPRRPLVPFAALGVGLYRASFEAGAALPGFYSGRSSASGALTQTFTDFALTFGGGVDLHLTRHVALRPEVVVLLATARSDARAIPVYGIQLAYHFEDHPITP